MLARHSRSISTVGFSRTAAFRFAGHRHRSLLVDAVVSSCITSRASYLVACVMGSSPRNDEASILSRAIDPDSGTWAPSVAQGILSLTLSPPPIESG
jgi:hypothetical protein